MKRSWLLEAIACTGVNTVLAVARPNILWIISDDLGPELGCGYSDVATPNIDRLAARGWRYSRAFSTAPVCSSSRSAFQTGRYQTSIGCHHHLTRDPKKLPPEIPTAIDLFRGAASNLTYRTKRILLGGVNHSVLIELIRGRFVVGGTCYCGCEWLKVAARCTLSVRLGFFGVATTLVPTARGYETV